MALQQYYLGCPMWANKAWVGELFSKKTKPAAFLAQYASVLNTVEGNTTFYALPTPATVERWKQETPPAFRFCLKFPRTITHDKRLLHAEAETDAFFELFEPLGSRLGPFFLQLSPTFAPASLQTLENFLCRLPRGFSYAVEVRNHNYFDSGTNEQELENLLATHNVDRVIFDTRGLHTTSIGDALIEESKRKKPSMPVRFTATGKNPFIRFCGDPLFHAPSNNDMLVQWADTVAAWIREGKTPYVFIHSAPDDFHAPRLARVFHSLLAERVAVGTMPTWPAEDDSNEQMALF